MVPLALVAIWIGGALYDGLILGAAAGLAVEWAGLCRGGPSCRRRVAGGVAWIALAAAAALWMRADPLVGRANIGFLVVVVWASDIGAYLTGRAFGGPKLAPAISPGKTWSGAAGGLVAAALVGVGIALVHGLRHPGPPCLARAAGLAIVVSLLGQVGDLAESWAKRRLGVKDSGRLIPGHGGLLDRLDAAIAVLPLAALLAIWQGAGVVLWR
jgi:phosphatidate cytidylyltransferase